MAEPTGFNKRLHVPIEFCIQPWNCDESVKLARTVLTRMVYDYIKKYDLQDEANKRIIHPDSVIKNTFHLKEGDTLNFMNLQSYMAKLYQPNNNILIKWEPKYDYLFNYIGETHKQNLIIGYQISNKYCNNNHGFVMDLWKNIISTKSPYNCKIIIHNKQQWSIECHKCFPDITKRKIFNLLVIGYQIRNKYCNNNHGFVDLWINILCQFEYAII